MAITKEEAVTADEFHDNSGCNPILKKTERWRRNGKTQVWKTRPNDFRIPVKYGLYMYGQIWHYDAKQFHTPEKCPLVALESVHPT